MNRPNKSTEVAATDRPPGASPAMYIVVRPNGERFQLEKEPLGGILAWARGQNVTVLQYNFATVLYTPPMKKEQSK